MNPLDLPGPQFLAYYVILAGIGYLVTFGFGLVFEPKEAPKRPLTEAYPIAYLRGGAREAIAVALATLAQRKWIEIKARDVSLAADAPDACEEPLERHILDYLKEPKKIHELMRSDSQLVAEGLYEPTLVEMNLLPNDSQRAARIAIRAFTAFVLVGLVLLKVLTALERGRTNVFFIVILCAVSVGLLFTIKRRRTPAGNTALQDLRVLFHRLRSRAPSVGINMRNADFAFLIAVFGLGAVSYRHFPYVTAIQHSKEPVTSSGDSSSSGCSSCSSCSSSSSSCGGSCGGGCGGCGG